MSQGGLQFLQNMTLRSLDPCMEQGKTPPKNMINGEKTEEASGRATNSVPSPRMERCAVGLVSINYIYNTLRQSKCQMIMCVYTKV